MSRVYPFTVQPGDAIRACFPARLRDEVGKPPLVPARLSPVLFCTATCSNAVRVGESQWIKSWVKVR